MPSSIYHNLDPKKHEIRILTILPRGREPVTGSSSPPLTGGDALRTSATDIHCILETKSLDDKPSYTALSYFWGAEIPCTTILVNSQAISVRENLGAALQHVRQEDHSMSVWADALCINQHDKQEKLHQVQLMSKIYESSAEVLVWLGPVEDDSDTAMIRLEDIGRKAIEAGIQDFRADTDMPNWSRPDVDERLRRLKVSLNRLAEDEGLDLFHPALVPLSKRAYWSRVWVLQEISVPRIVTLLCGSKRLDITPFIAAFNFLAFARWTMSSRFTFEDRRDPGSQLRSVSSNPSSGAPNRLIGARRRYRSETGGRQSLVSLLQRTCFCKLAVDPLKATDPRDKIYGLLSLALDSDQLVILPDYEKSVLEVYTDTSRALIANGQINILSWCQQPRSIEGLPSWVPDYSQGLRQPYGEDGNAMPLFCASGSIEFPGFSASLHTKNPSVDLQGIKVDIITNLGSDWNLEVGVPWGWEIAQRLIREVEDFCKQSSLYINDEQVLDASMRISIADQDFHGASKLRASSSMRLQYDKIRSMEGFAFDHDAAHYRSAMIFQRDRKSFLSSYGHVGLAPACSEPGDFICILFGSTVPFILRETPEGTFRLIGEAYVHGIMDGEWLDQEQATSTFSIH
jgi:hypothetical protein